MLTLTGCEPQPEGGLPSEDKGAAGVALPVGHGFDFYVLALSWSPSYCEAEGEAADADAGEASADAGDSGDE